MVLEQIVKVRWIERKEHSFFLGLIYTFVGILSAYLILPSYAGIMSIAFTSILLIPSLNQLLMIEENVEIREKKLSIRQLFKDHKDIIKVYISLFLGIFVAFFLMALIFSNDFSSHIFEAQLTLTGIIGKATSTDFFNRIVLNNLLVFIVCFILSLFYGAGSILFLTVNASAWGVYFGYVVKQTLVAASGNKIMAFAAFILPVLPHTITEALSYVCAAIVGGVVSKAVLREQLFSKKFHHIITDALIFLALGITLVIIAGALETFAFK
ncbi:stage II sporulation protein M [Candidatus Woesearchaeota archaeon]|nr:stage II sporulation protein M [Candidatus Woesearchaeota archaeon]